MIKQEIRALFLAHGFEMERQCRFKPCLLQRRSGACRQFGDIYGQPAGNVEIAAGGGTEAHTMSLFHDKAASIEFPTYIMRKPS